MSNEYFNHTNRLVDGLTARASDVNNLADEIVAGFDELPDPVQLATGAIGYVEATGSANAYIVALPAAPQEYTDGMQIIFKVPATNTGPSTVNVDGLGQRSIRRPDDSPLSAGDLPQGMILTMRFNVDLGRFLLQSALPNMTAEAVAARDAAKASEIAAALSEQNASDSETSAGVSAWNALASEGKAQEWAEKPEDTEVEPELFSAKHHALKAEQSKDLILDDPGFQTVVADLHGNNTIGTVAQNIAQVAATGQEIASVVVVSGNLTGDNTIGTVAGSIADVQATGQNIGSVVLAAEKMSAIEAAPGYAASAEADRMQTGLDRIQVNLDMTQAGVYASQAVNAQNITLTYRDIVISSTDTAVSAAQSSIAARDQALSSASSTATMLANAGSMLGINFGAWVIADGELTVTHLSTTAPSIVDGDLILEYETLETEI